MSRYLIIALLLPLCSHAQIIGRKGSINLAVQLIDSAYSHAVLVYADKDNIVRQDTATRNVSGAFVFSSPNYEPGRVGLRILGVTAEPKSFGFYLDTGAQRITFSKDLQKINISGSAINERYNSLTKDGELLKDPAIQFIRTHPDDRLSLHLIYEMIWQQEIDYGLAADLYQSVRSNKESNIGRSVFNEIKIRTVPRQAPVFRINDSLSLDQLQGKFVLLDFWASWCVPCREETPVLKRLKKDFDTDIEIIAISLDTHIEKWKDAIKKDGINDWYNILRDDFIKKEYFNGTEHPIPMLVLINRNGMIIWNTVNGSSRNKLRGVLESQISPGKQEKPSE